MQDSGGLTYRPFHGGPVADVSDFDGDAIAVTPLQPICIFLSAGTCKAIKNQHVLAAGGERIGKITADKAAASCNEDAGRDAPQSRPHRTHATNPRASS